MILGNGALFAMHVNMRTCSGAAAGLEEGGVSFCLLVEEEEEEEDE